MSKLLNTSSLQALGKNKNLRKIVTDAVETDAPYVVVPVVQVRDPGKGWPADEEGIDLMNTLALDGWTVVASASSAVVMKRPPERHRMN
jgi:hypothetical protein